MITSQEVTITPEEEAINKLEKAKDLLNTETSNNKEIIELIDEIIALLE